MKTSAPMLLALVCCFSCNKGSIPTAPQPTPTPKSAAVVIATEEDEFQATDDSLDNVIRMEARQAAADYLRSQLPAWKIKGISSEPMSHNAFVVGLDIEKDQERALVEFSVHKFFPESGAPYWKVTDIRATPEARETALTEAALRKQLAAAKAALEAFREKEDSNE